MIIFIFVIIINGGSSSSSCGPSIPANGFIWAHSRLAADLWALMMRQTTFYKYDMYYKIEFNLVIRGHHVYKRCSTPIMGETVLAKKDTQEAVLEYDKYVIGIFKEKEEELVVHIPIKLSQLIYHFLNKSNENFVEAPVSGKKWEKSDFLFWPNMQHSQKLKEGWIFFILNWKTKKENTIFLI